MTAAIGNPFPMGFPLIILNNTLSDNIRDYFLLFKCPPTLAQPAQASLNIICNANASVLPDFRIHHLQIPFRQMNLSATTGETLVDERTDLVLVFVHV